MRRILGLILTVALAAPIVSGAPSRYYPDKRQTVLTDAVTDLSGDNTYTDCVGPYSGLSFNVVAGVRYSFIARIRFTTDATTTGSAWSVNGPADPTELAYTAEWSTSATVPANHFREVYDAPTTSSATSVAGNNYAHIEGTILPSVDGTVAIRFMSEVDTSAVVCRPGSILEWWELTGVTT
jgi:hypothetical protein